jgi:phospholipase/carboxylesterase
MENEPTYFHKFIKKNDNGPTLLLLHGTGGNENDLVPIAQAIAPEFNIFTLRGNVQEDGMNRFFKRISEGVFDEEDVKYRAKVIKSFIKAGAKKYGFDINKVYGLGFSNGANMAAAIMLLYPEVLAGSILLRPMFVLKLEEKIDLNFKPILILSATNDSIVPLESVQQLYMQFRNYNAKAELHWQDANHMLVKEDLGIAKDWIDKIEK